MIISQIAQKAIYEKVKTAEPELVYLLFRGTGCGTSASKGKRVTLEERLVQPPQEKLQPLRELY